MITVEGQINGLIRMKIADTTKLYPAYSVSVFSLYFNTALDYEHKFKMMI